MCLVIFELAHAVLVAVLVRCRCFRVLVLQPLLGNSFCREGAAKIGSVLTQLQTQRQFATVAADFLPAAIAPGKQAANLLLLKNISKR
ncbi:hypothetical protein A1507_00905 [Methylomonas koyamae]|uniref:Uncharacterized protein n=1 Tax=Methylomonas koyamae TaxID=702114 RepID=A0A177NB05_9GAMM|nr:hypothetical protein A1507_00905 [Methylomonas koyamae]